jgi:hypothetical protein
VHSHGIVAIPTVKHSVEAASNIHRRSRKGTTSDNDDSLRYDKLEFILLCALVLQVAVVLIKADSCIMLLNRMNAFLMTKTQHDGKYRMWLSKMQARILRDGERSLFWPP